jgi:hypothetical protein
MGMNTAIKNGQIPETAGQSARRGTCRGAD